MHVIRPLIVFFFFLFSMDIVASGSSIRFKHLSVEQGLPQNSPHVVLQDRQGFLWISTEGGLARYDDYTFKVFKHNENNPHSISDNNIRELFLG